MKNKITKAIIAVACLAHNFCRPPKINPKNFAYIDKPTIKGMWLTAGDPLNYLKTTIIYALKRKGLHKEFKDILKN